MNHTPGPWVVGEYPEQAGYFVKNAEDTIPVCNIPYHSHRGEADARLIASAPALAAEMARLRGALETVAQDKLFEALESATVDAVNVALAGEETP